MFCRGSRCRLTSRAREDFKSFPYAPESSLVSHTSEMPKKKGKGGNGKDKYMSIMFCRGSRCRLTSWG